ncbi:hypothetical protein HPHPA4_0902 [Helicobacter pylori Hp A-4]|nr:hypothetical protein HPHPA4_0902 [Helicobacter pylori Hp A-4]ERA57185.1 hypothetical protein HMPREF1398_01086 [Helicobacter pylori GAM117Ai]
MVLARVRTHILNAFNRVKLKVFNKTIWFIFDIMGIKDSLLKY